MRNARRQTSQGRQFHGARLLVRHFIVFQKDKPPCVARRVQGHDGHQQAAGVFPLVNRAARAGLTARQAGYRAAQLRGYIARSRRIGAQDFAVRVRDHHAGPQLGNDAPIDGIQFADLDASFFRERLGLEQACRHLMRRNGYGNQAQSEKARAGI